MVFTVICSTYPGYVPGFKGHVRKQLLAGVGLSHSGVLNQVAQADRKDGHVLSIDRVCQKVSSISRVIVRVVIGVSIRVPCGRAGIKAELRPCRKWQGLIVPCIRWAITVG